MKTASASEFRENMKEYMEMVCENHEELYVSRPKNQNIVVVSSEDYESLKETAYLLSSPKNALRIYESLKQLEEGRTIRKSMDDL